MNTAAAHLPRTLGLFENRIEGDDCLMELAQIRFRQAGMGTEIYAGSLEQLEWTMRFRPSDDSPVVAHLSRGMNLADTESHRQIEDFARRFAGRIYGMVIHDHHRMADNFGDYVRSAQQMNARLQQIQNCPWLFVEYAVGVELETFVNFFKSIEPLERISVGVDIGHVGIFQTRKAYSQIHPGADVCAMKSQPDRIPRAMPDIEKSLATALPTVLGLIEQLGKLGKPAHFHLHDGHPLSTFSPFGVSDHLSFLTKIPLSFDYHGRRETDLMFGPKGLAKIVGKALQVFGAETASFTLEIHPTMERLPLEDAAHLFNHWQDKTNAEKMNHWISMLCKNHQLLREAIKAASNSRS